MTYIIISTIYFLNILLLYSAWKRQANFPYLFIFIVVLSNAVLNLYSANIFGVVVLARAIQLAVLFTYAYSSNIKIDNIFIKILAVYLAILFILYHDTKTVLSIMPYFFIFIIFLIGSANNDSRFDEKLNKLCKAIILFSIIYFVFTLKAGIGRAQYTDAFTLGGLTNQRLFILSNSAILLFGTMLIRKKISIIDTLYFVAAIFMILLATKRSVILSLALGLAIFILQGGLSKKRILSILAISITAFMLTSQFFSDAILDRFYLREKQLQLSYETIEDTGRHQEYMALPEYLKDNNAMVIFFGNGFGSTIDYRIKHVYSGVRSFGVGESSFIHTGFINTLYTMGIVGVIIITLFLLNLLHSFITLGLLKKKTNTILNTTSAFYGLPTLSMLVFQFLTNTSFILFTSFMLFFVLGSAYRSCSKQRHPRLLW